MFPFRLEDVALDYKNILLKHGKCIVNSRSECDISTEIAGKRVNSSVICANMPAVLNKDICKLFDDAGWFHIYHRIGGIDDIFNYVVRANNEKWNFVSISVGIKLQDQILLKKIDDAGYKLDSICIDVALSWSNRTEEMIKDIKRNFPNTYLIVGNGDNPSWIQWLENLGVDCAKIGIGVSKSCRTRQFTGFGSSTITDLCRCASAANNIKILHDGGLTVDENNEVLIGDIAKSIRFGSDYQMSGALFKNCLDNPAIKNGYFGNASRKAKGDSHVEGTHLRVDTNLLTMKEMIKLVEESLKSSVSYAGGTKLYDLRNVDYQIVL